MEYSRKPVFNVVILPQSGGARLEGDNKTSLEQELLFAVVKEKYGSLLSDEQLDEVRQSVLGMSGFSQALRSVPLTNDIEPCATFRPYRSD